ncbi:MAG: EFR1 family ferrodoxin [Anaerovoracaceae bacterium]
MIFVNLLILLFFYVIEEYTTNVDVDIIIKGVMIMETFGKIYFSPSGGTKLIADKLETHLGKVGTNYDLLLNPPKEVVEFKENDLVIVLMPVFAGRIPKICPEMLGKFNGNGANAISIVVYGNRDYDDALLELENILKENNFRVVAAGAFISKHTIFTEVAADRPDSKDEEIIKRFCKEVLAKIKDNDYKRIDVKGNYPYKPYGTISVQPDTQKTCTGCGKCVDICPVNAIDIKDIAVTNEYKCITCTACISICDIGARGFHGIKYKTAAKGFMIKCASRKEPEIFV